MNTRRFVMACGLAASVSGTTLAQDAALIQPGPIEPFIPTREVVYEIDSGLVHNPGQAQDVIYSTWVQAEGASWIRLKFDDMLLAGTPFGDSESFIRITSALDGAVQTLNMVHIAQWQNSSAYFNGDMVLVEIVAAPGTGDNHVSIVGAWIGDEGNSTTTICDGVDDRVRSEDPRSARYMPVGCSAWMFDDSEHCFGTAGHCVTNGGVMQFNVPDSNGNCSVNHPPPEDQYPIDNTSRQWTSGGIGNDYGYLGTFPNANTGLTAYEAQGFVSYVLETEAPSGSGQDIRITGYGTSNVCVLNQRQKTHVGPYSGESGTRLQYRVDTTGGNSGSPVIFEDTGNVIGVHTHGGCQNGGGANSGTSVQQSGWLGARANPEGVCAGPPGPPTTELFIASSNLGQIGAIDPSDQSWGVANTTGLQYDAMAYDRNTRTFYLIGTTGPVLYAMNESDFSITTVGTISGASRIHGAAFDPATSTLYGINENTGQLYSIDTTDAQAAPIGAAHGGRVGAMAINENTGALFAIDDVDDTVISRLIQIDQGTGFRVVIGSLDRVRDMDGLMWRKSDGQLYGLNDRNDRLYTINTTTGSATEVSTVDRADFGPSFGAAAGRDPNGCPADLDGDGDADADDFFAYLDLFAAGDARADLDGDGDIDADDFFAYLDLFAAGC